ncbi:MAG: hypothetical protein IJW92_09990 [Clostridia bacterium]|nr:hypothetical protein [Clostridia bacterium]
MLTRMKKKISRMLLFVSIVSILLLQFASCKGYTYSESGIENFSPQESNIGLTRHLIPEDFLNLYPYIDGGYEYYDERGKMFYYGYESALLYIVYDETTYADAKQYALENLELSTNSIEEYAGYTFLESALDSYASDPFMRVFFAYSDEMNILLTIGTYSYNSNTAQDPYGYASFSEYILDNFSFYNFEEGKIEKDSETMADSN